MKNFCVKIGQADAFLEEVERQKPECIRIEQSEQELNTGATSVFVVAGFISDTLYEMELHCGPNYARGDQLGSEKAKQVIAEIGGLAERLGISVYEGKYEVM